MRLSLKYIIYDGCIVEDSPQEYSLKIDDSGVVSGMYIFLKNVMNTQWYKRNEHTIKIYIVKLGEEFPLYTQRVKSEMMERLKHIVRVMKTPRVLYICFLLMKTIGLKYFEKEMGYMYYSKPYLIPAIDKYKKQSVERETSQ